MRRRNFRWFFPSNARCNEMQSWKWIEYIPINVQNVLVRKCTRMKQSDQSDKSEIKTLMREWRQTRGLVEKTVRSTSSSSSSIVWNTQQSDTFRHSYMHSSTAGRCLSTIEAHFPCFKLSACKRSPFRFLPLRHCLKIEFQYAFDVYVSKCFYVQHLKRNKKICGPEISPSKRE